MKELICMGLCFLIAIVQCHPQPRDGQENLLPEAEELLRKLMRDLDNGKLLQADALDTRKASQSMKTGCSCFKLSCGCCLHVSWKKIKIDDTVCVNLTYLPDSYGISFTLALDDHVLINETVSAKNPPPICADLPDLKIVASICLVFYDLGYGNHTLSGCLALEGRILKILKERVDLGCFKIPPGNHSNAELTIPYNVQNFRVAAKAQQREDVPLYFRPSHKLRSRPLK